MKVHLNFLFASVLVTALAASGAAPDDAKNSMQSAASGARYDQKIQQSASSALAKDKRFTGVKAATDDGIVTLTGSVALFADKEEAAHKIHKIQRIGGVINKIDVSTSAPDQKLGNDLARKLTYDRIGYDVRYNFFTIHVKDGVVTLDGDVLDYPARDSALSLVSRMPGVKDVIDQVRVAPVSFFDDDIRIRVSRAIYRDPVLSRYGGDPAAPIRIIVTNGKVKLLGTVAREMDKNVAGLRANGVNGVFSVENNLTVGE